MRWPAFLTRLFTRPGRGRAVPRPAPAVSRPTPDPPPARPAAAARVILVREPSTDHGTPGRLLVDGRHFAYTMEPPWRGNRVNRSCVPAGIYRCVPHRSGRFGTTYRLEAVPGRTGIIVHPGNYGGDPDKDLVTDTLGCLLLGTRRGWLNGQRVVLASRMAWRRFLERMGRDPFYLTIEVP